MGWLRNIERMLEEHLEGRGTSTGRWHALEAAQVANRLLVDKRYSVGSSWVIVPSLILIPTANLDAVPSDFAVEVAGLVQEAMRQRGFKSLLPYKVQMVNSDCGLKAMRACYVDRRDRVVNGIIEGVAGKLAGGLWGIAQNGAVVGRDVDVDVRLPDVGISRRHLYLCVEGRKIVVEDLGSQNGTFAGGKRLSSPSVLRSGVKLELGSSQVRLWVM